MTDFSPEFLEALADARDMPIMVAPAVLRECAAAWREDRNLAADVVEALRNETEDTKVPMKTLVERAVRAYLPARGTSAR